ncbi:MAG: hypothetical protein SF051_16180 [Elusimicrobiota bacterium]|nr:hypothetical protein [Elusimicrobiota bacterium]
MKRLSIVVLPLLLCIAPVRADDELEGIIEGINEIEAIDAKLPNAPPAQQPELRERRSQQVDRVVAAGDRSQGNLQAQLAVSRGFVKVDEPRHASRFADRAAGLAEAKGDSKSLTDALTLGALAYQKSGDYEKATLRSKRALELDPGNKMAMAVYQMSKGRVSGGAAAPSAAPSAAAAAGGGESAAGSGTGRSSFPPAFAAPAAAPGAFVGPGTEKALKLTAEAGRRWSLDRAAALRLLEEAVAADARNAAARAARARARLELGDAAGALEDAEVALAAGHTAPALALKGEALLALGRKGDEVLAAFKAAAELDGSYSARYQELIARGGTAAGASAPDPARATGTEAAGRPAWLLPASAAGLVVLALLAWLLLARRRDENAG